MTMRVMNFNAGPAALPLPALERAQRELLDFSSTGMSVMEQSHRGKDYEAVHDEAIALLRALLAVPASHEVIFLQGGATQQFAQVPMNFLPRGAIADYVINGVWGEKAVAEANVVARDIGASVQIAANTGQRGAGESAMGYVRVPTQDELKLDSEATYVHFTSNETIHGIQFAELPSFGDVPVVCDMSSDILSKPIDVARFDFIYAGAQKNIGPSGVVVGIVRRDFVSRGRKDIPKIFQYRAFVEANSLLNTPSTFGIYLVRNVLAWIKDIGGLPAIEARNREKADLLYATIDANPTFYRCPVERKSRSQMNVVFRLPSEALEDKLVGEAKAKGMVGIKGHRSVGGIRVSLYNAVEPSWVRALTSFMEEFARTNA